MAKINIPFNNKDYLIDESSLSASKTALQSHLSTVMSGSGAVINFCGTSYNVDSEKLATATSEFVIHLGTIAGSGSQVVVGGAAYGIDSAKTQEAIFELEAVLSGLDFGFYIKENEFGGETLYITKINTTLTPIDNEFGGSTAIIE